MYRGQRFILRGGLGGAVAGWGCRDERGLKGDVMRAAVGAKIKAQPAGAAGVFRSANCVSAEDSPKDFIWGTGADGTGTNLLGVMFMEIGDEMKQSSSEL